MQDIAEDQIIYSWCNILLYRTLPNLNLKFVSSPVVWMQVCCVSLLAVFQDVTLTVLDYSMSKRGMLHFTTFIWKWVGCCYTGGLIGDLTLKDAHSYDDVHPCIVFQWWNSECRLGLTQMSYGRLQCGGRQVHIGCTIKPEGEFTIKCNVSILGGIYKQFYPQKSLCNINLWHNPLNITIIGAKHFVDVLLLCVWSLKF